jgi:hypothetical protein
VILTNATGMSHLEFALVLGAEFQQTKTTDVTKTALK